MAEKKVIRRASMRLRWADLGRVMNPTIGGESATVVGNRIYFFGGGSRSGNNGELTIGTWEWADISINLRGTNEHVAVLVDDKIIMYGGENIEGDILYGDVIEYDIVTGTSSELEVSKTDSVLNRSCSAAVFAPWRREMIIFGGITDDEDGLVEEPRLNDTAAFHVDRKVWRQLKIKGQLPPARAGHDASLCGTRMYIYGGFTTRAEYLDDLWVTDLYSNGASWSKIQPRSAMPTGRSVAALQSIQNRLFLYGGYTRAGTASSELWVFHRAENEWRYASEDTDTLLVGTAPEETPSYTRAKTSDGFILFTSNRVFKLQLD